VRRGEELNPFLALHSTARWTGCSTMSSAVSTWRPLAQTVSSTVGWTGRMSRWARTQGSQSHAEIPGLDEKDVEVELANGVLARRRPKPKTKTACFEWGKPRPPTRSLFPKTVAVIYQPSRSLVTLGKAVSRQEKLTLLEDFPEDFRHVLGLQEMVPVGMADAYAQVTGRPAVVTQIVPGWCAKGAPHARDGERDDYFLWIRR
jgi:hypothetical protein